MKEQVEYPHEEAPLVDDELVGHLRGLLEEPLDLVAMQLKVDKLYVHLYKQGKFDIDGQVNSLEPSLTASFNGKEIRRLFLDINELWNTVPEEKRKYISSLHLVVTHCFLQTIRKEYEDIVVELLAGASNIDLNRSVLQAASCPSDFSLVLQALLKFRDQAAELYKFSEKEASIRQYCQRAIKYCVSEYQKDPVGWKARADAYLLQEAERCFLHDTTGQIWRLLLDIVFVPLGIVTLGKAFKWKEDRSGSRTFSGESTARVKLWMSIWQQQKSEQQASGWELNHMGPRGNMPNPV